MNNEEFGQRAVNYCDNLFKIEEENKDVIFQGTCYYICEHLIQEENPDECLEIFINNLRSIYDWGMKKFKENEYEQN